MLSQKKPSATANKKFSVLDIENGADGTLLAICHSWRENGDIQHRVFGEWSDWFDWITKQSQHNSCLKTVYAHNGGGWDWLAFLQWFVAAKHQDNGYRVGLVEAQSKLVYLEVSKVRLDRQNGNGMDTSRNTIRLADSMYLLRSGLNELSKKLLGRTKTEDNIEDVWAAWRNDKPRFYQYLKSDCELLLMVLEKSLDLIREHIATIDKLGMTIGSLAMRVYRVVWNGLDHPIETMMDEVLERFCRNGYHGGRVEVFRPGYVKEINVYDVNSLYPAAMVATKVPISCRGAWTNRFQAGKVGCYDVEWRQNRRDIPPLFLDSSGNGAYVGSGHIYSPEIELWNECVAGTLTVKQGWIFTEADYIFADYVNRLYSLRLTDKDGPVSLMAKFLLNSLYGKWAQQGSRTHMVIYDSAAAVNNAESEVANRNKLLSDRQQITHCHIPEDDPSSLIWSMSENVKIPHGHVAIAAMITSQARAMLFRFILAADSTSVVYCDTDSIHTTKKLLTADCGEELGRLKLEFTGEGVYCGKKLYAHREGAKEKIRSKGVSLKTIKNRHGFEMDFDDMIDISQGKEILATYHRPATFRSVLGGGQSCVINSRKISRTIRKTGKNHGKIKRKKTVAG